MVVQDNWMLKADNVAIPSNSQFYRSFFSQALDGMGVSWFFQDLLLAKAKEDEWGSLICDKTMWAVAVRFWLYQWIVTLHYHLVGGLEHEWHFLSIQLGIIIPTDELIFFSWNHHSIQSLYWGLSSSIMGVPFLGKLLRKWILSPWNSPMKQLQGEAPQWCDCWL